MGKQDKGVVEAKLGCDFMQNPIAGSSGLILQGNGSVTNASELLLQEAMAQVFLAPAPALTGEGLPMGDVNSMYSCSPSMSNVGPLTLVHKGTGHEICIKLGRVPRVSSKTSLELLGSEILNFVIQHIFIDSLLCVWHFTEC